MFTKYRNLAKDKIVTHQ